MTSFYASTYYLYEYILPAISRNNNTKLHEKIFLEKPRYSQRHELICLLFYVYYYLTVYNSPDDSCFCNKYLSFSLANSLMYSLEVPSVKLLRSRHPWLYSKKLLRQISPN